MKRGVIAVGRGLVGACVYDCGRLIDCALAGASIASYFLLPKATISLGASGAVFGLFAVSVLVKLSFNLKKLIECGILGQFVIKQLLQVHMHAEHETLGSKIEQTLSSKLKLQLCCLS